ncbi:MAG: exo-beta-N-acetylmuramidase NamZ family protein [Bacteriovorax sp.]
MTKVLTGLERLITEKSLQETIKGNIGYLCHSASIDSKFDTGVVLLQKLFGKRLIKLFGPQHGFVTDVQDNMVETSHYVHPYFKIPVYSLYSETRTPTDEMLEGIDTMIVDLQDVGTRVYTYISTLSLLMEKCAGRDIKIVVLDRPNPVGGEMIEGPILKPDYKSFVGRYPIPQRHSLTMGEMGMYGKTILKTDCHLEVVTMKNWKRSMYWQDTGLPWVLPSPNLPTPEGALTFAGTVLFEGTNVSEGRGTTRALEIAGFPGIESFSFCERVMKRFHEEGLTEGFNLRPIIFLPTFQKHQGQNCGGVHIHPTINNKFKSWTISQMLCREFKRELGDKFEFHNRPYEYEFHKLAIDLINGTDEVRHWVNGLGSLADLKKIETQDHDQFKNERENVLLY